MPRPKALTQATNRYFIALLPPPEIQAQIRQIQEHVAAHYHSRGAMRSPPHITLQAPFLWSSDEVQDLKDNLQAFATQHQQFAISLERFGAFSPRVIYVNVAKSSELLTLHAHLLADCDNFGIIDTVAKNRAFAPHITIAFRDLTRQNFKAAWSEFQSRQFHANFTANEITLLLHDGKQWNSHARFPFGSNALTNAFE